MARDKRTGRMLGQAILKRMEDGEFATRGIAAQLMEQMTSSPLRKTSMAMLQELVADVTAEVKANPPSVARRQGPTTFTEECIRHCAQVELLETMYRLTVELQSEEETNPTERK